MGKNYTFYAMKQRSKLFQKIIENSVPRKCILSFFKLKTCISQASPPLAMLLECEAREKRSEKRSCQGHLLSTGKRRKDLRIIVSLSSGSLSFVLISSTCASGGKGTIRFLRSYHIMKCFHQPACPSRMKPIDLLLSF